MSDPSDGIGRRTLLAGAASIVGLSATGVMAAPRRPVAPPPPTVTVPPVTSTPPIGAMELAVAARAPTTPTGFAMSRTGRMFVFMPRYDDKTVYTVGELSPDGAVRPFPDAAVNRPDPERPQDTLFHVPNGVFDAEDRLWLLDAGLMAASGVPVPGAAKLACVDVTSGRVVRMIPLGPAVEPTSSLNDLRHARGGEGRREGIFITDQGQDGRGAILAVDLAGERVVRRLARHSSTRSNKGVVKIVEGRQLLKRGADGQASEVQGGANGIALAPDGKRLYYAPLMGRRLYSVDTEALLDRDVGDAAVAATVRDLGEKGMTGGLAADDADRVYLSLQELNAIGRRHPDGKIEILATDPRLIWPDTFWITPDRWLYISSAQANRRPEYNEGNDRQEPPYAILRMRIDAGPA